MMCVCRINNKYYITLRQADLKLMFNSELHSTISCYQDSRITARYTAHLIIYTTQLIRCKTVSTYHYAVNCHIDGCLM